MSDRDSVDARLLPLLERLVARRDVMHAVTAVESGDGSFRWNGAAGESRPGTAMTSDTPYFLASIDKLYNAVIILRLWESATIDLDAPIASYLPPSRVNGLHRLNGVDRTDDITIRHLLGHTSGLADWLEDAPKGEPSLVERLIHEGDRAMSLDELMQHVRERLVPHFPPQSLTSPRPRARYSDTNYMLLVAIIEAVTGEPLHRVHQAAFVEPLGLRHTWFAGHPPEGALGSEPAWLSAGDQRVDIPLMMESFRGMYGTAGDGLVFMRALAAGRLFERPGTLDVMQARWNRFGLPRDRAALRSPQWPIEYGLGMMRFRLPRILSPFYAVPALLGHTGSTGSWLFHCPERDLFLSGTVDQVTAGAVPFRFVPKLVRAVSSVVRPPRG